MTATDQRAAIGELQQLTRDYASYSRSRGGIGNVLGGVVGLVVFGALWLFGGNALTTMLTIGLTSVWLAGKEVIRRRLYRRFGRAEEVWTGTVRCTHRIALWLFTPLLLAFAVWVVAAGWLARPAVALPYLVFCIATPLLIWRFLFTWNEIIIGFGLLFMCAITASGHTPNLWALLIVPAYAAAMIPLGLTEHRQFQTLEARLGTPQATLP